MILRRPAGKDMKVESLEKKTGYHFNDRDLLFKALTHSSYANENKLGPRQDNESLEFLGDSVVGMLAADYFFREFPDLSEGELSKLKSSATNTTALALSAKDIGLDKFLLLGRGEMKSGGRKKPSILAGGFEALAGAIYIDGGMEPVSRMFCALVATKIKKLRDNPFEINNYKSALQEYFLKAGSPPPVYRTIKEQGPAHKKKFIIEVLDGEKPLAQAAGHSKKAAEQQAAAKAFRKLTGRKAVKISDEEFVLKK